MSRFPIVTALDAIHNIKDTVHQLILFLKFDEKEGDIAHDAASKKEYDAHSTSPNWQGESVALTDNYFEIPAAPFNNAKDFTLACWVKTNSPLFTILSCKRGSNIAFEVNNRKLIINNTEYTYGV